MVKVALCFFGQPRYLDNDASFLSHKQFILDQNIDLDVHTHYWFDEKITKALASSWSECYSNYIAHDSPDIIERLYRPKRKLEEKPREFSFIKYDEIKEHCSKFDYYSDNQFYILLSQLYSFEKSIELALEYSKDCGFDYDFIISSRYDNKILKFPDLNTLEKGKVFTNGRYASTSFVDTLLIFYSKLADFKPYSNFIESSYNIPLFIVEYYKKAAFCLKNSIDNVVSHENVDVSLIRSSNDKIGQL